MKIASVGDKPVWELLVNHGKALVETGFGFGEGFRAPGQEICHRGIETMLKVSLSEGNGQYVGLSNAHFER